MLLLGGLRTDGLADGEWSGEEKAARRLIVAKERESE